MFITVLSLGVTDALKSMEDYWKMDMSFSLNLLKQFLEDMEAYSNVGCCYVMPLPSYHVLQELTSLSGMNESVSLSDEASTPEQCLRKLVALLRCVSVCVCMSVSVSACACVSVCLCAVIRHFSTKLSICPTNPNSARPFAQCNGKITSN